MVAYSKLIISSLFLFSTILLRKMSSGEEDEQQGDPYGAIKFGEFRKYMQNKQSKLKKQQKEL
jgi:hypothetical protein